MVERLSIYVLVTVIENLGFSANAVVIILVVYGVMVAIASRWSLGK